MKIQVDCKKDDSCSTSDIPEFGYPATRNNTQIVMTHAIDGSNPRFYIDKPIVTTCGGRCNAYYFYEVMTLTGAQLSFAKHGDDTDSDYVYLTHYYNTEGSYQFQIKIISYNNHTEIY